MFRPSKKYPSLDTAPLNLSIACKEKIKAASHGEIKWEMSR
jgi:hypothetical protein